MNASKNDRSHLYPFVFDNGIYPRDSKDNVIRELCSAIATTKESLKAKGKNPNGFEMKKRTRKDNEQRVHISCNGKKPSIQWNEEGFTFWKTKGTGIVKLFKKKEFKKLSPEGCCHYEVILKYEKPGRYFLCIPELRKKKENKNERMIAFDPGVRTFQTGFDSEGNFVEYGKERIENIILLGKKMDHLQSKIDQHYNDSYSSKKERTLFKNLRKKWRRQMGRISFKIKNLKKDVHWKMTKDIVQHYKHVMISRFQTSEMVKKMNRKINSETVRKLLNWNHFEFRQRLKQKAEEFNTIVHEVGEHYSSKGCGQCGRIYWKLGSSKIFHCPYCHFKTDRDFNGARNIFMMNLISHCYLNPSLS